MATLCGNICANRLRFCMLRSCMLRFRMLRFYTLRCAILVSTILLCAAASVATAQKPQLSNLHWLQGCWEQNRGARITIEQWESEVSGTMSGESQTKVNGVVVATEKLRIFSRLDTLIYEALPSGQRTTEFYAAATNGNEYVFENMKHDFPTRIVYSRVGIDSLLARIEGVRNGQEAVITFPFKKVPCSRT